ncbi:MAG: hypothetical protein HY881_02315 [Deltaproteobacteria bacterium]|nr:hypothetical protein [Deltaproteobacteria bacterium]
MKPFVYMIQSESDMPYCDLPDEHNDIILLTWKKPSDRKGAIYYPQSTWNEGRNRLLKEAVSRNAEYLYYIFLDGDCLVKEDGELARALNIKLCGNPFRTFEKYLLEWEPAVGYSRYSWQYEKPGAEVNLGYNFDALFNAFHREAISFLLPYYTGYDCESWLYSQHIINHLTALLYNSHRIQFNVITTRNANRKSYAHRKKYWTLPATFLMNAVTSDLKLRMKIQDANSILPLPGNPEKKKGSYRIPETFLRNHFNSNHPLIRYRGLEQEKPPAVYRGEQPRTAVCISGRCIGLDQTHQTIRECLLDQIGDHDVFMFVPRDSNSHLAALLNPTVIRIEDDPPLNEGPLINGVNCRLKTGVQPYLQQLYGLKQCNRMRIEHEKRKGIHYDRIIRCRPDLMFVKPLDNLSLLDLSYVHVPDFHAYDGINDRFAVGCTEHMNIYMNKLDEFHDYVTDWFKYRGDALAVSAEMFTSGQLRNHGIPVRPYPFRFNRARDNKIKNDVPGDQ